MCVWGGGGHYSHEVKECVGNGEVGADGHGVREVTALPEPACVSRAEGAVNGAVNLVDHDHGPVPPVQLCEGRIKKHV